MKKHLIIPLAALVLLTSCAVGNAVKDTAYSVARRHKYGTNTPTVNIENRAVQQYLSYGPYAEFGSTSYFETHADVLNRDLCIDQDAPVGFDIEWTGDVSRHYTVSYSDVNTGRDFTHSVAGTHYSFINLVPGHYYTYVVSDESSQAVRVGDFKAEGQLRHVTIADSWNYRDLGGWRGLGDRPIRYAWLYRGGSLNGTWTGAEQASYSTVGTPTNYLFSPEGLQQIRDLGIRAELELRGRTDEGKWGDESGIHSRAILEPHIPIADDDYKQIMTDGGLTVPLKYYSVVQDVAFIIQKVVYEKKPLAFHCKSGADRTGAMGMILEALLGVAPGDIARDYELTALSHEKRILNGRSSFQMRRADQATSDFFYRGFTTLTPPSYKETSLMQAQAYYYLNQQFASQGIAISARDLDAFIMHMLGMTKKEYAPYRHAWAKDYSHTLQSVYAQPQPFDPKDK